MILNVTERVRRALSALTGIKTAFNLTFRNPHGSVVLHELQKFCWWGKTCFDPDPRIHAMLEGRREVFQWIVDHMHLTLEELYALRTGETLKQQPRETDDD